MIREIGISISLGIDVLIFLNDKFFFLKDIVGVPNSISRIERVSNKFSRIPKEYIDHDKGDKVLVPVGTYVFFFGGCT